MEKRLQTRHVLVGENVTVADFVAAYTLDMASVVHLLETLPNLREYMERMYRTAQGTAAHCTGVREPPRLMGPREPATASANPVVTQTAAKPATREQAA